MALIIVDEIIRSFSTQYPSKSSRAYILVKKNALSEPYNLSDKSILEGVIIEMKDSTGRKIQELVSKKISLILQRNPYSVHDYLFILEDNWKEIRDYGIILDNSFLSIRIEKANELLIYPKRDVYG